MVDLGEDIGPRKQSHGQSCGGSKCQKCFPVFPVPSWKNDSRFVFRIGCSIIIFDNIERIKNILVYVQFYLRSMKHLVVVGGKA